MPEFKICHRTCVPNGGLLYFYLQFLTSFFCSVGFFSSGFLAALVSGIGEYGIDLLLPKVSLKKRQPKPYLSMVLA